MNTLIISDSNELHKAASILRQGGLVATPTETVYGLAANALDPNAVARIFTAKGRPNDNPLIVHIASLEDLSSLVCEVPSSAQKLIDAFWPGPLTLIFKAQSCIPSIVRANLSTVAIRFPSHPIMQTLIKESGVPIAAPSANLSGKPSPTNAKRVIEDLSGHIEAIIDGGDCSVGLESTVVDVTSPIPMILRPGGITYDMLKQVLGDVHIDPALVPGNDHYVPRSPGMKYTHYSPCADVIIVKGSFENVVLEIQERLQEDTLKGLKVGVLATDEYLSQLDCSYKISLGTLKDLNAVASHLFESLRTCDDLKLDRVYTTAFSEEGMGKAIMNRLEKSAGYHIIDKTY